jgi:uncharacterized membrane protein YidH (DUF202 family)
VTTQGPPAPRPEADDPDEPLDPGLQAERTYLAWQRTGLGLAAIGALLLHSAIDGGQPLAIPGALTLVVAAVLTARAQRRYRSTVSYIRLGRSPVDYRVVATTAALTVVLGIVGLGAIVVF